jgi:hypothetical protein
MARVERDEAAMRADPLKQRKFNKLAAGPFFETVVALSRAYLDVAIVDAVATERDRWALSCLPGLPGRLSAISMRRMEAFVVFEPHEEDENDAVGAFVIARRSTLERYAGGDHLLAERFPELTFEASMYADAGPDQIRVIGWHDDLMKAFQDDHLAAAVQGIAEPLLAAATNQWPGHNYQLADHVLNRV